MYLRPGAGTGTSNGELIIQTPDALGSGTTVQSYTDHMTFSSLNKSVYPYGRMLETEGNNVTAANTLDLGKGNFFTVNGNTQVNTITAAGWSSAGDNPGGAKITLYFTGTLTVKHNTAGVGASIITRTGADIVIVGNYVLELIYDANNSVWRQPF